MNALLRLLRIAPDPEPDLSFDSPARPHVAGRGSGEAVGPKLAVVRRLPMFEGDVVGPRSPYPEYKRPESAKPMAGRDDPTPIFDAVMADKWWLDTPEPVESGHNGDRAYHALATQLEVALILDLDRAEMAATGELGAWLAGIDDDVALDIQTGWES